MKKSDASQAEKVAKVEAALKRRPVTELPLDAVKRKRAVAPTWKTIGDKFGHQDAQLNAAGEPISAGYVRNAKGEIRGYKYPETGDPAKDAKTAREVYEMWEPHRRVSSEIGMSRSAKVPTTTLLNRATGARETVPAMGAERKVRIAESKGISFVEAPRYRGKRVAFIDAEGRFWRRHEDGWELVSGRGSGG